MQSYQYFSGISYILLLCLIISVMPNFLMKNTGKIMFGLYTYLSNNKLRLLMVLNIFLTLYVVTYRKPLEGKEEIINKLTEEANNNGLDSPPFKFIWDGCSGGISALTNLFFMKVDWQDGKGCLTHDYAYWRGGSFAMKKKADTDLYDHIISLGHSKIYAYVVWIAIALGGMPFIPAPWRWGYGYPFPQKIFF